jgi:glyoxylase-like metal-dependent hydrolase (beta-lactamase superfamily II)
MSELKIERRSLLKSIVSLSLASMVPAGAYALARNPEIGAPLPARADGELDIHHIDTGRGNCALIVGPDGTAMMIDAGITDANTETSGSPRPDGSRRPGEWMGRYALRQVPSGKLKYLVVTHLHADHMGGVPDVDALLPIETVIDRGFPDYGQAQPPVSPYTDAYLAYLRARVAQGRAVEKAVVGSERQIQIPALKVRSIAASGYVWSGVGDGAETHLPNFASIPPADRPGENVFSQALRLSYGKFSYWNGGDLSCDTEDGRLPWWDTESPAVRAAGRTEVATADHHGYFDACGPQYVRSLDAQAYIVQAWDIGHPGSAQMQRMVGDWPGRTLHDVFVTDLLPANALMNRRFAPKLKSQSGHVVVRVSRDGESYRIFVVDSSHEVGDVTGVFGPYRCRG